jgi:hypothetical protein
MNPTRVLLFALLPLVTLAATTASAPSTPLQELKDLTPKDTVFAASGATKPITLKTATDAATYFAPAELAKLTKQVDFNSQIVLLFAWQGSGQDKLDYTIAESFPEQIKFTFTPGRTKDLRQHIQIYALRNNVTWSAK